MVFIGPLVAFIGPSVITTPCHGRMVITTQLTLVGAMRQRILGSHTPPCHRRMVITTLFSVFLVALQRRAVQYHTRWSLTVLCLWFTWTLRSAHTCWGGGGVIWRRMSSTWMSRVVMNHFFFHCCSAMGRSFSIVEAPAIFGMHVVRPLFQVSRKFPSSYACCSISSIHTEKNS